ncbi:hypothetical protein N7246_24610 [Escherichia coli]|uniref:hypothetical protein n=1 Tax=Escherichia coli TaxID=562 RepID=UPI0021C08861|nr:hypothetical protein [Escherichia coli]MCT9657653.1 hypothetical protein [Escherichia coli]
MSISPLFRWPNSVNHFTIASELDVGDERTEMFEIYSVLRNLCRRGYATQVGRMTNPLLSSCDEDDSDEDDE